VVSRLHEAARHVAAHFAESDNTDLHLSLLLLAHLSALPGGPCESSTRCDTVDEMHAPHSPITPGLNRRALRRFVGTEDILLTRHLMINIAR
jgi:hypothetical protein